jgi:hypothetical protein
MRPILGTMWRIRRRRPRVLVSLIILTMFQRQTSANNLALDGCPVDKDTCPNSGVPAGYAGIGAEPYGPPGYSGPDPIHNFMDYSTDVCYEGFTAGQGARMLNIWQIYRQGL